ncbi:MAG TPA: aminoacyl-tRNA hydrolase [Acidobacteriota bacterium]|nr:aminoacyl-tRNA hydrolase [Acidobacteriota bacterium]
MHIIVGLGNPGSKYARNRHNVGFMLLDRIADKTGISFRLEDGLVLAGKGELAGKQVLLAKPQVFMNSSGAAVASLLRRYPVNLSHLLIAYDDVALPLGGLRLRRTGSSGGHKGMASVMQSVGSQEIARIRIGVGPGRAIRDLTGFVLADFEREEVPILNEVLDQAVAAVEMFISEGIEKAMSQFNSRSTGVKETR